jgi:hypothetical protein
MDSHDSQHKVQACQVLCDVLGVEITKSLEQARCLDAKTLLAFLRDPRRLLNCGFFPPVAPNLAHFLLKSSLGLFAWSLFPDQVCSH